jgi:hypothetical protein
MNGILKDSFELERTFSSFGEARAFIHQVRDFGEYFFCALPGFKLTQGVAGAKKIFAKILDIAAAQTPKVPKQSTGSVCQRLGIEPQLIFDRKAISGFTFRR